MEDIMAMVLVFVIVVFIILMPIIDYLFRFRCPACGSRRGRELASGRWDGANDQGQRGGGAFSYMECRHCLAHWKKYRGTWDPVDDDEWKQRT